jgi:hypothetical protein
MAPARQPIGGFFVFYCYSCTAILCVTTGAKLWAAHFRMPILAYKDPLLQLDIRHLLILTAIYEIVISCVLVLPVRRPVKAILVGVTGAEFLLYHVFKSALGLPSPCPCLGNIPKALGLSDHFTSSILVFTSSYFVCGGLIAYLWGPPPMQRHISELVRR